MNEFDRLGRRRGFRACAKATYWSLSPENRDPGLDINPKPKVPSWRWVIGGPSEVPHGSSGIVEADKQTGCKRRDAGRI